LEKLNCARNDDNYQQWQSSMAAAEAAEYWCSDNVRGSK